MHVFLTNILTLTLQKCLTPVDLATIFDNYVSSARAHQSRLLSIHNSPVILVGTETEYIRHNDIEVVKNLRKKYFLDYIVGSVHHVREVPIDFSEELYKEAQRVCFEQGDRSPITFEEIDAKYSTKYTDNEKTWSLEAEALFRDFFDSQHEMLVNLKPEVVGHFDLVRIYNPQHRM
ncbi:histidinolphosphatase, partial [Nowakowskiella sp. JEL0078]